MKTQHILVAAIADACEAGQHLIMENGYELGVDKATAKHLVDSGLIYLQKDDPACVLYHCVDPHTLDAVETAIARFDAQPVMLGGQIVPAN